MIVVLKTLELTHATPAVQRDHQPRIGRSADAVRKKRPVDVDEINHFVYELDGEVFVPRRAELMREKKEDIIHVKNRQGPPPSSSPKSPPRNVGPISYASA